MRQELRVLGPVFLVLLAGYLATSFFGEQSSSSSFSLTGAAVVASTQCPADKTLFKLSAMENAHAAVALDTGYGFAACWEGTGSSQRACTEKNIVLKLSAATNAHVEGPTGTHYQTPVCFGSLSCITKPKGQCPQNSKCVASLSSATNAHVAKCGFYDLDLCCSETGTTGGGGEQRKDTDGDGIWDDGDLKGVGSNYCNPTSSDPKRNDLKICDDNCISIKNTDQLDSDNDGAGDACDALPKDSCSIQKLNDNCPHLQQCKNLVAQWDVSSVVEGESAALRVTGSPECGGRAVLFKVFDKNDKTLLTIDPQPSTFSNDTNMTSASSRWIGEYFANGSNMYYFQATVTGGSSQIQTTSPLDKLLTVTKKPSGQAQCGNGKVEGSNNEECDDGNTRSGDGCSSTCKREGNFTGGRNCQDDAACKGGIPPMYMVCQTDQTLSYFCITGPGGCKKLSNPLPCGKVGDVQRLCARGADSCRSPSCSFTPTSGACVNGQKTTTFTPSGGSHCTAPPPRTDACIQPSGDDGEPFPVFSGFNIVVTILLLITFYFFRGGGGRWRSR